MSRVIRVKVVNSDGYGLSGMKVKAYGGDEVRTDRDGEAVIDADGSKVSIYVNGRTAYEGYAINCPNPLIVRR